eukprot:snap_masked-scaffold_30-processed-gene-3.95-mRNA-1 protein AED:1.00 eAED:1.00 QI:0/0/0/0/1/1/2/0/421
MYCDIAKTGIGFEFCRRRAVLRDNYIYFLRTGLGLTNNNHNAMDEIKDGLTGYIQKTGDSIWKHQGKYMDQVSTARLVIEGQYPEDEKRVVNVVRTDFRLTNDDITRFLQAKFPNNYGWNRNKQRIVLASMSYEESLDVAHDLSWLDTTADALDYLNDSVPSTEKPVKAVGSVLLVDEHFIFIAVHLRGRLGKKVIIYDSMVGNRKYIKLSYRIAELWQHLFMKWTEKVGGDWNYEVKAFQEQQDSHNCGVFALIHCLQFMNVTFSGGIRRVGAKPVNEMREHLFEWENHPRFRADDETVLQTESVTAKVRTFVEDDVVREEEDESEDTETNEDDEARPTEDGQHNEEDDEENVQMSEDEGGKFLGQQMIDQRFDDVGASGMDMIAMDTEGQPPTPLSDVTTVLETQNDLHLSDITTVPET